MGLLSTPFRGLLRVFEEVADRAEQELYNEDAVRADLTDIYMKLEAESLTEGEFARREAELVERLEEIEEHQKQGSHRGTR
jgi:hypothetical protein